MNLIEQTVGTDAFERLIARMGGTEYAIPTAIESPQGQQLAELIGPAAAFALIRWGGGDRVYVVAGQDRILRARAADIARLHADGKSARDIALGYTYSARYTERQIRNILRDGMPAEILPTYADGTYP